jgi:hypothetical protein
LLVVFKDGNSCSKLIFFKIIIHITEKAEFFSNEKTAE